MSGVAAIIITKNEERNIADCLATVGWVDEVIVVDAESSDRTAQIARTVTPRVYVRAWPGYGPQKNFGIDQTEAEWILIVDADERVSPLLEQELKTLLARESATDIVGYEVPRRNFFYGRWIQGGGLYPDYQLRFFRRSAGRYDDTLLHERLCLNGRIERLSGPLDHYSMPTIQEHVRKMRRYTTLGALEKLKSLKTVTSMNLVGHHLGTILRTYVLRKGYQDGLHGLIVAGFAGMHTFVKYAKAWEALNIHKAPERS